MYKLPPPIPAQQLIAFQPTHNCSFNGQWEKCLIAGGSGSFTVTYASDNKRIEIEKVGDPYPCSDGTVDECGKLLITEPRERRTTWGTYRVSADRSTMTALSSRGNLYKFQF